MREGSDIGGGMRTDGRAGGRAVGRKATKSLTPKPTRSRAGRGFAMETQVCAKIARIEIPWHTWEGEFVRRKAEAFPLNRN